MTDTTIRPTYISLILDIEGETVATFTFNHHEKNIDLDDPEAHQSLGKIICEELKRIEAQWIAWQTKVREACNCSAKEKDGMLSHYHSRSCASWDISNPVLEDENP